MILHIKNGAAFHMLIANRNICHLGMKIRYLFCVWGVFADSEGKQICLID